MRARFILPRCLFTALLLALPWLAGAAGMDDMPPGPKPYETLRYAVDFDGGPNAWSYEVRLFTDRSVLYTGRGKVKTQGRRQFRLSQEQYDSLLRAFEYANFPALRVAASGGRDTAMAITHTVEGRSHTLRAGDPGPRWPKALYQLIYAMENVLRVTALACPIAQERNKEESEACAIRTQQMEQYYPRR